MDGQFDAVVVGGGAAGTFAAYRLLTGAGSPASLLPQEPAGRSVALIELSDRIGGRLESLVPPGMESLRAEFGGMGYTSADTWVNWVIGKFSLGTTLRSCRIDSPRASRERRHGYSCRTRCWARFRARN